MDRIKEEVNKDDPKPVRLDRIVVPKHLRIVSVADRPAVPADPAAAPSVPVGEIDTQADAASNTFAQDPAYLEQIGEGAPVDPAIAAAKSLEPIVPLDAKEAGGERRGGLAKMGLMSAALVAAIGVMLIIGRSEAPSPGTTVAALDVAATAPVSSPASAVPAIPASTDAVSIASAPIVDLAGPAAPRFVEEARVQLPVEEVTPTSAPRVVANTLLSPSISQPLPHQMAPPPRPSAALSDQNFLKKVTYGTVAALRGPGPGLPSAAESALFGFVRSVSEAGRSPEAIGAMLAEAQADGTLTVPARFLKADGQIDVAAIFAAMERVN